MMSKCYDMENRDHCLQTKNIIVTEAWMAHFGLVSVWRGLPLKAYLEAIDYLQFLPTTTYESTLANLRDLAEKYSNV